MADLLTIHADDLTDVFLDSAGFGELFNWTHGSTLKTLNGVWDDAFATATATGKLEALNPSVLLKTTELSGVAHRDTIYRASDATTFYIVGIQPDGAGVTRLILSRN